MSVLLTGASGFIAAVILDQLVKKDYKIVATVRNQEKADWINKLYPNANIAISFVGDIAEDGAFDQTFKDHSDIEYVLHTASPFHFNHTDPEKDILNPAIKGTTGILHSIKKYGPNVKHVVVTSSFAAMLNSYTWPAKEDYTEESWNPVTYEDSLKPENTYIGSKKLAEKVLWDFVEQEKPSFTASTVNPVMVFGPGFHKVNSADAINTSNKAIYDAFHATEEASQNLRGGSVLPFVHVNDVAAAHVVAIENPKAAAGKRWLATSGLYDAQLLLDTINKVAPELKGKIPVGKPYSAEEIKELEKTWPRLDNSATQKQTGIKFAGLDESVADTLKFLQKLDEQWGTSI
uniref:ARAD1C19756p n=1 Tax=Blastobotrys adeninivorans TaxID=409370 RepID=A0A060T0Z3_BLAAD